MLPLLLSTFQYMNKFDRVISTLVLLQTKRIVKANSIAERFDVSLRTVYRDIATLKNAGVPISGDPGVGYTIVDGYRLPPLMFNEGEAASLLTAEKFIGKLTDTETQQSYSNALMKIRAVLRSAEKQSLSVLDNSIEISRNSSWDNNEYLQDVFKSVAAKQVMQLEYQKADGTASNRKIEPIGCYHQVNKWYLIAFCQKQQDYRTFKMNRIVSLAALDERFETKHIGLQDYIKRQEEAWKKQQNIQLFEVAFTGPFVEFAEGRKFYFGFVEQTVIGEATHMKFLNSSVEIMARWIIQFGDQATVIAPLELKERMKVLANQLFTHYS